MCGIAGTIVFNANAEKYSEQLHNATRALSKRGPDAQNVFIDRCAALGHARLSIIDTSEAGTQPMNDHTGRYVIVFNGEIYNYPALKKDLLQKGYVFHNNTDTEVLLNLYAEYGTDSLQHLNGFFAFAIYDKTNETVFMARDRMGIKPFLYYKDETRLVFASEMKAIVPFLENKQLHTEALYTYLQLNYTPAPFTMFKGVEKLSPGHYITADKTGSFEIKKYYSAQEPKEKEASKNNIGYENAQAQFELLLRQSVEKRLIADVPLGSFLSGGMDSSVIAMLAAQYSPNINTFSIGFKDEPYFDETYFANLVAKKIKTNHTVFSLSNNDLLQHLFDILDYLDDPFADSSAIAVYILCKETRNKITVALSGDGADELLGGYNKHYAEWNARNRKILNAFLKISSPVFGWFPQSRNSFFSNKARQLSRYAGGLKMTAAERYWRWCAFTDEKGAGNFLSKKINQNLDCGSYMNLKRSYTCYIDERKAMNDVFYADLHLVLPNDMLTKVDLMSMANSLEVRVPFLDHELVDFVFSLPSEYKITSKERKKILADTFRKQLPEEIFTRAKHGFEVPLLKWFRNELRSLIEDDLLNDRFVSEQNIFNTEAIKNLKQKLFSSSPGDAHAHVWALLVFQYWWKKHFN